MKCIIFTEGGGSSGLGHIARCLALSQAFRKKGIFCQFMVNGDRTSGELLAGEEYILTDWVRGETEIDDLLKKNDIAVVDSYLAAPSFYEKVSALVGTPVFIDDNKRIDYPQGVIVNGNIYAPELDYLKKEGSKYLLGLKYAPMREEFRNPPRKKVRQRIEEAVITFGGNDKGNMTPLFVSILKRIVPSLRKKVLVGKTFDSIDGIKPLSDENTELIFNPGGIKMRSVMESADVAFSGGGQTLAELARAGVPTLALCVADNQVRNVKAWQESGFLEYLMRGEEDGFSSKVEDFLKRHEDPAIRQEKSDIGRKLVDGKGAINILNEVISYGKERQI